MGTSAIKGVCYSRHCWSKRTRSTTLNLPQRLVDSRKHGDWLKLLRTFCDLLKQSSSQPCTLVPDIKDKTVREIQNQNATEKEECQKCQECQGKCQTQGEEVRQVASVHCPECDKPA